MGARLPSMTYNGMYVNQLVIPGVPQGRILEEAEAHGLEQPHYSIREIGQFFFQWKAVPSIRRKLLRGHPEIGTELYYTPIWDNPEHKKTGQQWSLGEVERMAFFFYNTGLIDFAQFMTTRSVILWVARGYGLYYG